MQKNNYLEKNLKGFSEEMAESVRSATPPEWYAPTKGKNGDASFSILRNGRVLEAFNNKAPRAFSKKVVQAYPLAKTEAMVIIGAGVGHVIGAVLKKAEKGFSCLLVEPDLFLIKEALTRYDVSRFLKERRLIIATTEEEAAISLSYFETIGVVEDWYVVIQPYTAALPDKYFEISDAIGKRLNAIRCNTGTMMGAGSQIANNDLSNVPYLLQYPGVEELKDKYKGRPAVVISTGPSLAKNIHILLNEDYRNNVVVIAVAQAARILYAYGIDPDYICTVDYGDVNASHFRGLENCGFPLVALNRTYAPIFETWRGPVYVATSLTQERNAITDVWLEKGHLDQGGSVSHFAFGLAVHLGCTRIALLGQDLAYEGAVSHNPLADSSGTLSVENNMLMWKITDPRSPLYGTVSNMGPALPIPGFYEDQVITNTGLSSFITAFTALSDIYKKRIRLFNCTEGGADIPGFRKSTLLSFLKRFAKKYFYREEEPARYSSTWRQDYETAISCCKLDSANISELLGYCTTGLESLDTLSGFVGDKKRKDNKVFLDALKENERASNEAHTRAKRNPLLESAIYKATRAIAGKELFVPGKKVGTDDAILKTRIARNRTILSAAKTEAEILQPLYAEVLEKLKNVLKDPEYLRKTEPAPPSIADAAGYLAKGNWALPLIETRRILAGEADTPEPQTVQVLYITCMDKMAEAIKAGEALQGEQEQNEKKLRFGMLTKKAREAGTKGNGYRRSHLLLLRAHRIDPDNPVAWYGLASVCTLLGEFDTAIAFYDKLLVQDPDNHQWRYERILATMGSGEIETGFADLSELMGKTDRYDSILFSVAELFYDVAKDKERGIAIIKQYLEKFPNNPEAWKILYNWTGEDEAKYKYNRLTRGERL